VIRVFFTTLLDWLDLFRRILLNGLFALFLIVLVVLLVSSQPVVQPGSVLLLDPHGELVEQVAMPSTDFPVSLPDTHQAATSDLIAAVLMAKDDDRIALLRLDLSDLQQAPLSRLRELRAAILEFRQSGKPVVVYGNNYSQAQYFLASASDHIYLHPMGLIELTGFSLYRTYVHSALERLNIDVEVFKAGRYKSALEPFARDGMSPEDRQANTQWLSALWTTYKQEVAEQRKIDPDRIQQLLDRPASALAAHHGRPAELFLAEHLVTQLADAGDVEQATTQMLGLADDEGYPAIDYRTYLDAADGSSEISLSPRIAVITASGTIVDGMQPPGAIGSETLCALLHDARSDERIKAVVLRIDSPGGSALASEVVRKEILRLRTSGKPVVVSMGSMAASGGYWIASAADQIWASPVTLTGSIGVFGLFPHADRALSSLGIHSDGVGTTAIAGGMQLDRPLHPELARSVQMGVDAIYRQFVDVVAQGRRMQPGEVAAIAEGRVWVGSDALRLGLVDRLGDIDAAIDAAADLAQLGDDFTTIDLQPEENWFDLFLDDLMGRIGAHVAIQDPFARQLRISLLTEWYPLLYQMQRISGFHDRRGVYAYSFITAQ